MAEGRQGAARRHRYHRRVVVLYDRLRGRVRARSRTDAHDACARKTGWHLGQQAGATWREPPGRALKERALIAALPRTQLTAGAAGASSTVSRVPTTEVMLPSQSFPSTFRRGAQDRRRGGTNSDLQRATGMTMTS